MTDLREEFIEGVRREVPWITFEEQHVAQDAVLLKGEGMVVTASGREIKQHGGRIGDLVRARVRSAHMTAYARRKKHG
jgi:hypothetical protein